MPKRRIVIRDEELIFNADKEKGPILCPMTSAADGGCRTQGGSNKTLSDQVNRQEITHAS